MAAVYPLADKGVEALNPQAEAYLAAIISSSDDAIISKNLNGVITSWNASAERIFGYNAQEAVGQNITLIIPTDRLNEETEIISRLCKGERIKHYVTVRQTKSGKPVNVSITVSPIRDSRGVIIGASKVARDVTERYQMLQELEKKAEQLIEKDRLKDEFLAMLAHELRNPLAPISNALQLLELGTLDPAIRKEMITMANRQVSHMVRLLDDLLDLSRITHGKITVMRQRIDLLTAIRSAIESVTPFIDQRGHTLRVEIPREPVWVDGDTTRLSQLFGNLLNNAAKYTNGHGLITLEVKEDGKDALIRIRDNGVGIPPEKLPLIFDMFTQVDSSLERTRGGLGIGLALVKSIAELHNATVEAVSEGKNKGTEFTVRLPLSEPAASRPADRNTRIQVSGGLRVLVVDDNEASARTLGAFVESMRHEVRLSYSAKDALIAAKAYKPDVILLDIGLPDATGYDVCKTLRADPALSNTRFIAQTGWGQEQHLQRCLEAGFDEHLIKPVNMQSLRRQLEKAEKKAALSPA